MPINGMLDLAGDISQVHDPAIMAAAGKYYIYSTGRGISIRESTDLVHWRLTGAVFAEKPAWITTTDPRDPNALWAPDLSYFGGKYHLYYSASSFGSNDSCIGHATSPSLEDPVWEDKGAVICSSSTSAPADNWNAIDPAVFVDGDSVWMAFGSFWGGLKLIRLDIDGARVGDDLYSLSTRANTAVEAPFLVRRGDYYYLFESVDFCCRGASSDYKTMVGRSTGVAGPYVDRDGTPLTQNGGTPVLIGDARWKGPGHNAILQTSGGDYNVYHSYDAQARGTPTLRIAELTWSSDGWPQSAGP